VCAVQRGDVYFTPTQYVKKELLYCNTKDQKVFGGAQLRIKYSPLAYSAGIFNITEAMGNLRLQNIFQDKINSYLEVMCHFKTR